MFRWCCGLTGTRVTADAESVGVEVTVLWSTIFACSCASRRFIQSSKDSFRLCSCSSTLLFTVVAMSSAYCWLAASWTCTCFYSASCCSRTLTLCNTSPSWLVISSFIPCTHVSSQFRWPASMTQMRLSSSSFTGGGGGDNGSSRSGWASGFCSFFSSSSGLRYRPLMVSMSWCTGSQTGDKGTLSEIWIWLAPTTSLCLNHTCEWYCELYWEITCWIKRSECDKGWFCLLLHNNNPA